MMNKYFFIIPLFFIGCVSNSSLQCDETYNDYYCPTEKVTFNLGGGYYPSPMYIPHTPSYYYNPYFHQNNCNPQPHHNQNNNQQRENRPTITGPRPTIISPNHYRPKSNN